MLYEGKVIDRRGSVEEKNTVSDNSELRRSSTSAPSTHLLCMPSSSGAKVNVIDAPGSDDFIGGTYSTFKVCESGVLVINAQQGFEVGTENVLRLAEQELPLVIAVNQLDSEKADWEAVRGFDQGGRGAEGGICAVPREPRPIV